jgi:uncharacterized protein YutE (UPF0331/DUF86 family)
MVRRDLAAAKVARATGWLEAAESRFRLPEAEFLADSQQRDLATFYLFLAIQECIDLAAHWVADDGWTPPDDIASTFDVLADHGALPRDLAQTLRAATGLRNRIAHGYALFDHRRLHTEARQGIAGLRHFLLAVAQAAGL